MTVDDYREAILQEILAARDEAGEPLCDEKTARDMLSVLSDTDLEMGMPFNTPAEVARTVLESL